VLLYKYYYSFDSVIMRGQSWSNDSWIYNLLCNHFLSPLTLWVRILLMQSVLWLNLSTCSRSVDFSRYSGFLP